MNIKSQKAVQFLILVFYDVTCSPRILLPCEKNKIKYVLGVFNRILCNQQQHEIIFTVLVFQSKNISIKNIADLIQNNMTSSIKTEHIKHSHTYLSKGCWMMCSF